MVRKYVLDNEYAIKIESLKEDIMKVKEQYKENQIKLKQQNLESDDYRQ